MLQTTTTRLFLFLGQEFSVFSRHSKIMSLWSLCSLATATAATVVTIALPASSAPARSTLVPTSFVFPGSLPHLASAARTRWPPRQAVHRRDGGTVSFFSLSPISTTATRLLLTEMTTRHGHGVAGDSRGRRPAGGGGEAGVTRSRVPPSPPTSSPRSLGSGMGALWGIGGEVGGGVGSGRGGLGDDDSEINERDGYGDDVDVPTSEQDSLAEKKVADGSTGASRADIAAAGSDGKDPSTPPPPLAIGEVETEKRPAGAGEAPPRRGRSDSTVWMPQLFPPSSEEDDDESFIKPLIELPLDGILLQLFPALLIGVLGLFLTIAVQVEASRFDGMVGEDGGAVVVTDLRETRKAEP